MPDSISTIAYRGLEASRKFHLWNRQDKRLQAAQAAVDEMAQQNDFYADLDRITEVAASQDHKVELEQHQALLGQLSRHSSYQAASGMAGLAGLALLYTELESLSGDEKAQTQRRAVSAIAEIARDPLLAEFEAQQDLPAGEVLQFIEAGGTPAEVLKRKRALGGRLVEITYRQQREKLTAEHGQLLDRFAAAQPEALLAGALVEDPFSPLKVAAAVYQGEPSQANRNQLEPVCRDLMKPGGWLGLLEDMEALKADQGGDKIFPSLLKVAGEFPEPDYRGLARAAAALDDDQLQGFLVDRMLRDAPAEVVDFDRRARAWGLDSDQRLRLLDGHAQLESPSELDRQGLLWNALNSDTQKKVASDFLAQTQQLTTDPVARGLLSLAAVDTPGRKTLDLLFADKTPENFTEMSSFCYKLLDSFEHTHSALAALSKLSEAFRPLGLSQEQGEMVDLLEGMGRREAHHPDRVLSTARIGLSYMDDQSPLLPELTYKLLDNSKMWLDAIPIGGDGLGAMKRLNPSGASLYEALLKLDKELEPAHQGERQKVLEAAFSLFRKNPDPGESELLKQIRRYTDQEFTDIKVVETLGDALRSGVRLENFQARFAHEVAQRPCENLDERLSASAYLMNEREKGLPTQAWSKAVLRVARTFDQSTLEERWVLRRGLELGGEMSRRGFDRDSAAAFETALQISTQDYRDRDTQLRVPKAFLEAFRDSEKPGPAELSLAAKSIWRKLDDEAKQPFLGAFLGGLASLAESLGDTQFVPVKLEELEARLAAAAEAEEAEKLLQSFFDDVGGLSGELYWSTLDPPDDLDLDYGEDEVVIGDIAVGRQTLDKPA